MVSSVPVTRTKSGYGIQDSSIVNPARTDRHGAGNGHGEFFHHHEQNQLGGFVNAEVFDKDGKLRSGDLPRIAPVSDGCRPATACIVHKRENLSSAVGLVGSPCPTIDATSWVRGVASSPEGRGTDSEQASLTKGIR